MTEKNRLLYNTAYEIIWQHMLEGGFLLSSSSSGFDNKEITRSLLLSTKDGVHSAVYCIEEKEVPRTERVIQHNGNPFNFIKRHILDFQRCTGINRIQLFRIVKNDIPFVAYFDGRLSWLV